MSALIALSIVALCACINRIASGWLAAPPRWPGRPLWYAAPAIALVAWLVQPWPHALLIGAGYLRNGARSSISKPIPSRQDGRGPAGCCCGSRPTILRRWHRA